MNETQKLFYRISEHLFAVMKRERVADAVVQQVANALEITFADLNIDIVEKED